MVQTNFVFLTMIANVCFINYFPNYTSGYLQLCHSWIISWQIVESGYLQLWHVLLVIFWEQGIPSRWVDLWYSRRPMMLICIVLIGTLMMKILSNWVCDFFFCTLYLKFTCLIFMNGVGSPIHEFQVHGAFVLCVKVIISFIDLITKDMMILWYLQFIFDVVLPRYSLFYYIENLKLTNLGSMLAAVDFKFPTKAWFFCYDSTPLA